MATVICGHCQVNIYEQTEPGEVCPSCAEEGWMKVPPGKLRACVEHVFGPNEQDWPEDLREHVREDELKGKAVA
jgi:hypothetical protein